MKKTAKIIIFMMTFMLLIAAFSVLATAANKAFTVTYEGTLDASKYPQENGNILDKTGANKGAAIAGGSAEESTLYAAWRKYVWASHQPYGEITLTLNDDYTQNAGEYADSATGNWTQEAIGWNRPMSMTVDLNGKALTFNGSPYAKNSTTRYDSLIYMNYSYGYDEATYPNAVRTKLVFKNGTINLKNLKNSLVQFNNDSKMDVVFENVKIVVDASCAGNFGIVQAGSWNAGKIDDVNIIFKNCVVDASAVTGASVAIVKLEYGNRVDLTVEDSTFNIGAGIGVFDGRYASFDSMLRGASATVTNSVFNCTGTGYAFYSDPDTSTGLNESDTETYKPPVFTLNGTEIRGKVHLGRASLVLNGGYYDCTFEGSQNGTHFNSTTTFGKYLAADASVKFSAYPTFKSGAVAPGSISGMNYTNIGNGEFRETERGLSWVIPTDYAKVTFTFGGVPVRTVEAMINTHITENNVTFNTGFYTLSGITLEADVGDRDSTVELQNIDPSSISLDIKKLIYNLSLENDMSINLAIPAEFVGDGLVESITVEGSGAPLPFEDITVEGKNYRMVTFSSVNVMNADKAVVFNITEGTYGKTQKVALSPLGYGLKLLLSDAENAIEKELARSILAYILAAQRYFGGDSGTITAIEAALSGTSSPEEKTSFGESIDTTALGQTALYGASISFINSTPAFIIELDEGGQETTITVSYKNHKDNTVRRSYVLNETNRQARILNMKIADFGNELTIRVGNRDYKYNLATYLNAFVNHGESAAEKALSREFANAIYNYVQTAKAYKIFASAKTVKYSDFGADVTGKTDSFAAIWATHEYANKYNLSVEADEGATYYIGTQGVYTNGTFAQKQISVKTDTDWKNAKFIIDDTDIDADTRHYSIFLVKPDRADKHLSAAEIAGLNLSAFKKGACPNVGMTFAGDVLLRIENANEKVSIRSELWGTGENKAEILLVHADGTVDESTPLLYDYTEITSAYVYSASEKPITICGGEFTTRTHNGGDSVYVYRGIRVERANTTVKGVKHYIENQSASAHYMGFFFAVHTNNITFEDCVMTAHLTQGSYDTTANDSNNVKWVNCTQVQSITDTTYWGVMSSSFSKNLTYDGCVFSRFDAHRGLHNVTIKNSEIGHQQLAFVGSGTALIENTTVHSADASHNALINLRNDYGATWDGDIIIKNCALEAIGTNITVELIRADWLWWDYGYECHIPNVYLDGMECYYMNGNTKVAVNPDNIYLFDNFTNYYNDDYRWQQFDGAWVNGSWDKNAGTPYQYTGSICDKNSNNKNPLYLPEKWETKNFSFNAWVAPADREEYKSEAVLTAADLLKIEKSRDDAVLYSDFGADVTGATDAFRAIWNAHEYANKHNLPVRADDGAVYYIYAISEYNSGLWATRSVQVRTDTDWRDAKFIIDDSVITAENVSTTRSYDIFFVAPTANSYSLDLSKVTINPSKLKPGSTNIGIDFTKIITNCPEKLMLNLENENEKVYKRTSGGDANMQDLIVVDKYGNIIDDTAITFDYSATADVITKITVYSAYDTAITLKGGRFYTRANQIPSNGYAGIYRGIRIERSNVTLDGVEHYMIDEPTTPSSSMPYNGFFFARYANNITFKNCTVTGHRVYQNTQNGSWNGSYDISTAVANGISFINCNQKILTNVNCDMNRSIADIIEDLKDAVAVEQSITDNTYWGVIGTNFSRNITLDRCRFSRFDAHSGVYNVTVTNSEIGYQTLNFVGNGRAYFENTTVHAGQFISLRGDYGATWNGEIIIKNCALRVGYNDNVAPIVAAGWSNWDFGYECHLPSITVEGFKVYRPDGREDTTISKCIFLPVKSLSSGVSNVFDKNSSGNINPYYLPERLEIKLSSGESMSNWTWFWGYNDNYNAAERAMINAIPKYVNGVLVEGNAK